MRPLVWVEISKSRLQHNIQSFKQLIGKEKFLCPAVKANAYGHGLKECAPIIGDAGADLLAVNALFEALAIREAGVKIPVYIMGYVPLQDLEIAIQEGFHLVVYNRETLEQLAVVSRKLQKPAFTHVKLETGIHRQGVNEQDLVEFLQFYKDFPLLKLEGLAMHFANIEDNTDHTYAMYQLENFDRMVCVVRAAGFDPKYVHSANTVATIMLPKSHFTMVRSGIGNYGLWPSEESIEYVSKKNLRFDLQPVLSFKSLVVQIKDVSEGSFIGYGCTYKTERASRIAIVPVGYYDGYDRKLSNRAEVLIRGKRAPVRGRVCMNMIMVDVTNIPEVKLEDEVVLIGEQKNDQGKVASITADEIADWVGTIHYEVTTRINERIPRIVVK